MATGLSLSAPSPSPNDVEFLRGESFVEVDGVVHCLRDRNGIEALSLGNLRADLGDLLEHRSGGLRVTDNDTSLEVALWVEGQRVLVFVIVVSRA